METLSIVLSIILILLFCQIIDMYDKQREYKIKIDELNKRCLKFGAINLKNFNVSNRIKTDLIKAQLMNQELAEENRRLKMKLRKANIK